MMKPTSFETVIRLQFDTLLKHVIDCNVKDCKKELDRRAKHEIFFCELPDIVVQSFAIEDDYDLIKKSALLSVVLKSKYRKANFLQHWNNYRK